MRWPWQSILTPRLLRIIEEQVMKVVHPEQEYLVHLAEGRFMIQRSVASGDYVFYPRVMRPGTLDDELEWTEASGDGVVYSTSVVRNRPPAEDYNVALIDLAEGVRMMSRVVDIAPEAVKIGMKVKARMGEIDGAPVVLFVPFQGDAQ